jgi:hypothetical protein
MYPVPRAGGRSSRAWIVHLCVALLLSAGVCTPARADFVADWVATTARALAEVPGWPRWHADIHARIAMFEAMNAIDRRYVPLDPGMPRDAKASPEAAAATAVFLVLAPVAGVNRALIDARYEATLQSIKDREARDRGVSVGRLAAYRLLARQAGQHLGYVAPEKRAAGPGIFELAEGARQPGSIAVSRLGLFALPGVDALDPGTPPAVDDPKARAARREAMQVGAIDSRVRTADQTAAAIYWNASWNSIPNLLAAQVVAATRPDPLQHARLHALWAVAFFDASVIDTAIKDRYRHWRPENAIRGTHADPEIRQPGWRPLIPTPTQPDWLSGGAIVAGVHEIVFGTFAEGRPVEWSVLIPETFQRRTWPSAAAMAEEAAYSRLWAGAHFRYSVEAGLDTGRRIARHVIETTYRSIPAAEAVREGR